MVGSRIGPEVDYHGKRVACLGTLDESLPNIERVSPAVGLTTNRGRSGEGSAVQKLASGLAGKMSENLTDYRTRAWA